MKPVAHIAALCILFLAAGCADASNIIEGRASVIDGDTIDIHGTRIRLSGIDAPEQNQRCDDEEGRAYRCGRDAAFHLDDMIKGAVVRCDQRDVDRYKRIISECFSKHPQAGEVNINATMVVRGHALAYRKYSTDYIGQEDKARKLKRGMWRGEFVAPWEWRKARR